MPLIFLSLQFKISIDMFAQYLIVHFTVPVQLLFGVRASCRKSGHRWLAVRFRGRGSEHLVHMSSLLRRGDQSYGQG